MATSTRSPVPADAAPVPLTKARLAKLKISAEVAWYMQSRGLALPEPWQAPLFKTPEAGELDKAAVFDPDRVDKVLRAFGVLRHTKGDWAGRPLDPDAWQVAYIIAPVSGWVKQDENGRYRRIVRECWVEVSRKNGKSTLLGGLGLYMTCADGEEGAECVAAATTRDQAQFVFNPIRLLAKSSQMIKPYVSVTGNTIVHKPSGSSFKSVAAVGDSLHGANLHFYCVDEVHVHKSPDLIEAIETGTGSRSQPLGVLITTADEGKPDTVYIRKRARIVSLAQRAFADPGTYGVIWAAAESEEAAAKEGLDLFGVEAQKRANPGYGVSPGAEYLQRQALIAKQSPADYSKYLRLHLGIRTKQATTYITIASWNVCGQIVDRVKLAGSLAYGGLDLASTSDFTAFCSLHPDADGRSYDALWRLWIPEGAFAALVKRTSREAEVWRREGRFVVTDGDVVDDERVIADILADWRAFKMKEIGYDPWNASSITQALMKEGVEMVPVRQGFASLSPPLKQLKNLVLGSTPAVPLLRHGGHPVIRWMLGNLAVAMDPAGNVKPDRKSSADKIDGVAAVTIALSRAMTAPPIRKSAYEGRGLTVTKPR